MTKIAYQLRAATEADYPYCYYLTKQNMYELFARHFGGWVSSAFRRDFHAEETTIIQVDGQAIGYFCLQEGDEERYLSNLQISPDWQGQGIGSAVLRTILSASESKPVKLMTFTDNPAMRLYERIGFEVTERDGETVYMLKR